MSFDYLNGLPATTYEFRRIDGVPGFRLEARSAEEARHIAAERIGGVASGRDVYTRWPVIAGYCVAAQVEG